ncbi:MAG: aldo/keto reductase [Planctomycetota bacterium]|jgi:aryl-alcohol dehydrogenase-like predicted oxidoreductase
MKWERREFLKVFPAVAAKIFLSRNSSWAMSGKFESDKKKSEIFPKRTLGKTKQRVSIIAMGGIVVMNAEPAHAARVVAEAVEKGINYFDVAPTYGDAELKLGPALKPYREKAFLACKTQRRDRKGAHEELNNSLKNLQTDHFDLYQLHAITDVEEDVKAALGKGGAIETFIEARKQGIIRYIGFSAHSPQAALAAMREFDFDTVMYPINFACHYNSGFETDVLAEAKKRGMGIIAIKAMAKQRAKQRWQGKEGRERYPKCWYEPIDDPELVRKALSWSLAQSITVAVPPGEESLYRMAVEFAPRCQPPTNNELLQLQQIATGCAAVFT